MIHFWEDQIKDVPVLKELVANWKQIKTEVLNLISDERFLYDYPRFDKLNGTSSLYKKYWKVCPLSIFDDDYAAEFLPNLNEEEKKIFFNLIANAKRKCPTVDNIIKELEEEGNIRNVFVSRLVPGSVIHPHHGYTDNWMRAHVGLVCDPGCKIIIGGEMRIWEEGKLIAFRDGDLHTVRHEGKDERIVISVDLKISYLEPFLLQNVN